eukprot:CAMPEP_0171772278 /NCGR_PEP_ID=MMETSP0991-20121206/54601_1 /TAXON_ID=483369 /ORGANISM="non described non described, Strain CCMP2098" /LENGTH=248 /DNA_ID=CAMNT_0012377791 /DNA_START=155 /DNA_END=901 /DNA_ORIENTATION=+
MRETNILLGDGIVYVACSTCDRLDTLEMDQNEPGIYYCTPCYFKQHVDAGARNDHDGTCKDLSAAAATRAVAHPPQTERTGSLKPPKKETEDGFDKEKGGNVVIPSRQAKSRPAAGGGGAAAAKALKLAPKPTAAGQSAKTTAAKSRPARARQAAAAAAAAAASASEDDEEDAEEDEEIGKFIVEKCTTVNKKSVHVGTRTFDTRRKATDAQAQMDKEWDAFKEKGTLTAQGVDDFKKHLKDVFDSFM